MKILLIQDNPDYVSTIKETLSKQVGLEFKVKSAMTLNGGITELSKGSTDIVLLELSLPDSKGLDTFLKVQANSPMTPIVILTGLDDEMMALKAVRQGAQDYLLKAELEGRLLIRVIRYAIERQKAKTEIIYWSFEDDLTGVYNRRGFWILAEQQMKLTSRSKKESLVFMLDVDGLKKINDTYGHGQGDAALSSAAGILSATFRKSDIIARIGGDEFAVMAVEANRKSGELLSKRLLQKIETFNKSSNLPFQVSMSFGYTCFDASKDISLEEMLDHADVKLYSAKSLKQSH